MRRREKSVFYSSCDVITLWLVSMRGRWRKEVCLWLTNRRKRERNECSLWMKWYFAIISPFPEDISLISLLMGSSYYKFIIKNQIFSSLFSFFLIRHQNTDCMWMGLVFSSLSPTKLSPSTTAIICILFLFSPYTHFKYLSLLTLITQSVLSPVT